jgi:hypothetical protein
MTIQNVTDDFPDIIPDALEQNIVTESQCNKRKIDKEHPHYYTNIVPLVLPTSDIYVPIITLQVSCSSIGHHLSNENDWLEYTTASHNMNIDSVKAESNVSWPAYHASRLTNKNR